MSSLINATKLALVFLSAAGYYATWYILLNNGTTDYMAHIRDVGPRLLPGTKEPVRTVYTGIPAIDYQMTVLALFFWEIVDGSNPAGSLFCFHFATQIACGWGLVMIESLRHGNRWTLISFVGIWGIFVQNAAYAVIMPNWCIAYLSTSRMVSSKRVSDFLVDVPNLVGIAISVILGYVLPTILMSLPAPSIIDYDLKQWLMTFWQFFPVWVSVVQGIVPYLLPRFGGSSGAPNSHILRSMRIMYAGLLSTAGIGQAATMAIMATSKFFPGLFAPEYVSVFNPSRVFLPAAISPSIKMPSIGAGTLLLLQYDHLIGSTSMALWSTLLFVNTYRNGVNKQSLALVVFGGVILMALTGPLGYATAYIWARDELIIVEAERDGKKVQ